MSDKIINQIKQMRLIAATTHSRAEAETMLQLATKLIIQHQISECELETKSPEPEQLFVDQNSDFNILYETGRSTGWKANLAWGLAELHGLYCLKYNRRGGMSHRQGSAYRVFGRTSDIEICKYVFGAMVALITELGFDYVPGSKTRGINPERESWAGGCVAGFLAKMKAERQMVLQASNATAMVLVGNRVDQAKSALMAANPNMHTKSCAPSKASRDADAWQSGYRRGQTLEGAPHKGLKS